MTVAIQLAIICKLYVRSKFDYIIFARWLAIVYIVYVYTYVL